MTSIITVTEPNTVTVDEPVVEIITIGIEGPQGPPGPGGGAASLRREEPLGTIDGANTTFSTAVSFVAGSTVLYLNGLAQSVPEDYAESAPDEIETVDPPQVGDRLLITYVEA